MFVKIFFVQIARKLGYIGEKTNIKQRYNNQNYFNVISDRQLYKSLEFLRNTEIGI